MAECKIIVVGCNHGVQPRDRDWMGDSDQVKEHKAQFQKLIDTLIKENKIQFIGEEWGPSSVTNAYAAADDNKIPWANINTTNEELDALKIPRDYVNNAAYSADQKEQWTRQRDPVMLAKILEHKAERFLVVCGFGHFSQLSEMLDKTCKHPEKVDCRTLDWYDDKLFSD
jgi:hypothetical protein